MLIAFNKPWGVLPQFSDPEGRPTLKDYIDVPGVYPAGRLDRDSEGLLLLTDDGALQQRIADPAARLPKTYWAQVEGTLTPAALHALRHGVLLNDGPTRPAQARALAEPAGLWPRVPPIRVRRAIPVTWLALTLTEGRNRQVRRMSAAVGLPTLRLIRVAIGALRLADLGLAPGSWRAIDPASLWPAPQHPPGPARRRGKTAPGGD